MILPVAWKGVTMDASFTGWGTVMGFLSVEGMWSPQEGVLFINILELQAVPLALRHWTRQQQGLPVKVQSYNAMVVAYATTYVNHQGGTRSGATQMVVGCILPCSI